MKWFMEILFPRNSCTSVAANCVQHMLESLVSRNQTLSILATTHTSLLQEKPYTLIIQRASILIWKSYCALLCKEQT
jgi:hypothetical protein